jgi:hypothetical protein
LSQATPGRQHVRSELPLQNRVELPHAIPLLGSRQICARDDRAKGRDDDIRQLSVGNVWLQNLQLVDEVVYFVGQIGTVPGGDQFDL